ncbi:ribosome biogenesis protein tsr1 [Blomia tropicalis]|nr:ribosome biogenesis protein tsr1 [Blomia tropicalis]
MEAHRPGPYKQRNKAHKCGKKRTNRETTNGGRTRTTSIGSIRSLGSKKGSSVSRNVRKNQLAQIRKLKREELLNARRGIAVAPVLIAVLNLGSDDDCLEKNLLGRLQSLDSSSHCVTSNFGNHLHIELPKFRTSYEIMMLHKRDLFGSLDLVKLADILLLLHSSETEKIADEIGVQGDSFYLLDAIYNHCLPQTVHAIMGLNKVLNPKNKDRIRRTVLDLIEKNYPGTLDNGNTTKLRSLDTSQDLLQLFHYCSNVKRKTNSYCSRRSQLLAEDIQFKPNDNDSETGTLLVDGFIRNNPFNVNSLVYIPEFGEFQLKSVEATKNPFQARNRPSGYEEFIEMSDPELQPSLNERENPIETLHEQEMAELDNCEDFDEKNNGNNGVIPTKIIEKKKVPKGTSDYQAAWIIDSDEENDDQDVNSSLDEDEDSGQDETMDELPSQSKSKKSVHFAPIEETYDEFDQNDETEKVEPDEEEPEEDNKMDYDGEINMEEEEQALAKFKEQRAYEMFPDEIDTPADVSARERFSKYRGLKSFRTSTWDCKENLPPDYSRISQFENFNRTKRRLFKTEPIGADIGFYVRVNVMNVPRSLYEYYQNRNDKPLILFQLLAHEHKMSVLNIVLKKVSTFSEPIQSKEELIFHLGCRRFAAKPIYSAHTVGDKHKYERYLRSDVACVATIYAPITFPPTPVLVYKRYNDGQQVLVATGSLLDCSPNRLIIKRFILSGHPFKINRRHAVVRYMFFNREDILWFRPIELRTKYGRRGHIMEPLGTHGHMKCTFDHQLNSQDTVLMCLYKRVFPKWSYRGEQNVPEPIQLEQSSHMEI